MEEVITYEPYRKLPLMVEFLPLLFGGVGVVVGHEELAIWGLSAIPFVYLILSWWLFKSEKFKVHELIFALGFGVVLFLGWMGLIFIFFEWEYYEEMCMIGFNFGLPAIVFALIYYFLQKDKKCQFTFSLKVLSRLAIMEVLLFIFFFSKFLY